MGDWVKGMTYEVEGNVDAHFVYPDVIPDMTRYELHWSDENPFTFISHVGGGGQQDLFSRYKMSKLLTVDDSDKKFLIPMELEVIDTAWTFANLSDKDDGSICFDIGTVLEHNSPDISISDASVLEGDSGTNQLVFQVSLSEMALGDPLRVYFETRHGSTNTSDFQSSSGSVFIPVGESVATITVDVFGDVELEGDEIMYVDLTSASHGNIVKSQGVGLILGDDAIPCGADTTAGGDGVQWFSLSSGSDVNILSIMWNSHSLHDRWDVFANGVWVDGSNAEVDKITGGPNPPYDKPAWDAAGGVPSTAFTKSSLQNRAGSGIIFIPSFPAPFWGTDPVVYEVRSQGGGSGTGWDLGTLCNAGVWKVLGSSGETQVNDNRDGACANRKVIYNLDANTNGNFTAKFDFLNGAGSSNTMPSNSGSKYDFSNSQGIKAVAVTLTISRGGVILVTQPVAAGALASFTIPHRKGVDDPYLLIHIQDQDRTDWGVYTGNTSGKNKPIRCLWQITSTVL